MLSLNQYSVKNLLITEILDREDKFWIQSSCLLFN